MGRKKSILLLLVCSVLFLTTMTSWANSTGGGAIPKEDGQSEIWAGVVVDYMGKLRFVVRDRANNQPISGVSVELFVPSLNRYVLFGVTDADGIYELDIAYNMSPGLSEEDQFATIDGSLIFQGTLLYLNSNEVSYQIYKSGWLSYPHQGTVIVEAGEVPQTVEVYLYKKSGGDGGVDPTVPPTTVPSVRPPGSGGGSWFEDGLPDYFGIGDGNVPKGQWSGMGGIPKTGIEGAVGYWIVGLAFFLLAGGILGYMMRQERQSKRQERGE